MPSPDRDIIATRPPIAADSLLAKVAMRAVVVAVCATLALTWPGVATAGPFDVFGFGSRALGMGGAMTAAADDYTAVYYNPAGLTLHDAIHLGVDVYAALPSATIEPRGPFDPAYAPETLDTHGGTSFGVLFPLGGLVENRFALGLGLHLPFKGLLDITLLDPQVPQWYRYDALPQKLQLALGAAYHPFSWLHVGVGFQGLAQVDGGAQIETDLANSELTRRDLEVQLVNTIAPTAGILVAPPFIPGLRLGASYRGALGLDFSLPIVFDFGEALDVVIGATGVTLYVPEQVAFGAAMDLRELAGWPVLVSFDVTWAQWSQAPPPNFELFIDVEGELIDGLGLGDVLDFETGDEPDPGFRDTITPRVGLEGELNPYLTVRTGYGFRPTALQPQTGFTNYVDADAHIVSAGLAVSFPDPLQIHDTPITFEVSAQSLLLRNTTVVKDNPDGPVGDYDVGGSITTVGVSIRHDY